MNIPYFHLHVSLHVDWIDQSVRTHNSHKADHKSLILVGVLWRECSRGVFRRIFPRHFTSLFFYSQRDSKGSKYCLRPQFSITIQTPIKYIASRRRKASMQTQTFRYHGEARTERYSFYYDKWKPAIFFTSIFCAFITHKSILNCVHGWDNIRQLWAGEL